MEVETRRAAVRPERERGCAELTQPLTLMFWKRSLVLSGPSSARRQSLPDRRPSLPSLILPQIATPAQKALFKLLMPRYHDAVVLSGELRP